MRISILASVTTLALSFSNPASAAMIFGSSCGCTGWTLTINGSQAINSIDTGYITSEGEHWTSEGNYLVGSPTGERSYNNFGVFDLSSLSVPVDSAVLSLISYTVEGGPINYSLVDVAAAWADLDAQRAPGDSLGQSLFNDLGSGTILGTRIYNDAEYLTLQSITLNDAGIGAINKAAGGTFILGGTTNPSSAVTGAVPEPGSWAMMIAGFGIVGAALRKKRKKLVYRLA